MWVYRSVVLSCMDDMSIHHIHVCWVRCMHPYDVLSLVYN